MIKRASFTREWILGFREQQEYSRIDTGILEKMIHALALAEMLSLEGLDFVFKGGTSLVLLLKSPARFSIDIDIITQQDRGEVERILDKVKKNHNFIGYEPDRKRNAEGGIPKAHYFFYFNSVITGKQAYILFDVVFESSLYKRTIETTIETPWTRTEGEGGIIKIPSLESITGDKITAYAPNTTGIPYGRGKEMEIIKQLFDLSSLYGEVSVFGEVIETYNAIAEREIGYRGMKISRDKALNDVIETGALMADARAWKSEPGRSRAAELQSGIKRIRNFMISKTFHFDEAVEAAAKAAYMAAKIMQGDRERPAGFDRDSMDINDFRIEDPKFNYLNRLVRKPNGALFYWKKALDVMGKQEK